MMIEPPEKPDHERHMPVDVTEAIDAELSLHIELLREQIEREGLSPDEAAAAVRRRFGDVEQYRRACRRIALKEEIMKQRMQYIAMGVMLAIIAGLAIHALVARQRTVELLRAMDHERARTEAVTSYMTQLLSAQDALSDAREVSIREMLDEASMRVSEWNLKNQPEIEARLREAIDVAKQAIHDQEPPNAVDDRHSQEDHDESPLESSLSIIVDDS